MYKKLLSICLLSFALQAEAGQTGPVPSKDEILSRLDRIESHPLTKCLTIRHKIVYVTEGDIKYGETTWSTPCTEATLYRDISINIHQGHHAPYSQAYADMQLMLQNLRDLLEDVERVCDLYDPLEPVEHYFLGVIISIEQLCKRYTEALNIIATMPEYIQEKQSLPATVKKQVQAMLKEIHV